MKPGNHHFNDSVPIHTKRMLWKMGERIVYYAFLPLCRKAFCFLEQCVSCAKHGIERL